MDVQLTILDEIGARLENITVANGYRDTIKAYAIERGRLEPFENGDLPAVNYWSGPERLVDKQGNVETRELPVMVEGYKILGEGNFNDVAIKFGNDIATALFRATTAPTVADTESPALGGIVEVLRVESVTPVIQKSQAPWCAVFLELTIQFSIFLGKFDNFATP